MAVLITRQLSQKLYASACRAISSTFGKPYWVSKFPDGKPRSFDEIPVVEEKNYDLRKMHENYMSWFHKYGYVSKEWMTDNTWAVHLYHFQDFMNVYDSDGRFPLRKSHGALRKYREERKDQYDNVGLGPGVGNEWWALRSMLPRALGGRTVRPHESNLEAVADDLVNMLHIQSKWGEIDTLPWLFRWAFESTGVVTLNRRMNALSRFGNEEADKIVEASVITNEMISQAEVDSLNYQNHYSKLAVSQDYMYSCIVKYVEQIAPEEEDSKCLAKMLLNQNKGFKNAVTLIMDIFQGGLQTVPLTVLMALYNLALNKDVQDAARKEVMELLPSKDSRYFATVKRGKYDIPRYLNGVLWETLRVNPPIIGNGRLTQQDLVLGGYQVPKGTNVIMHHQVAGILEENFAEPLKYKPERHPNIHTPYLEYVFGDGERMCLGKNFSLSQMALVIAKILREFEVSYEGGEVTMITKLHNEPEEPIYLDFTPLV